MDNKSIFQFGIHKYFSLDRFLNMVSWIYCQSRLAIIGCLVGGGFVFGIIPYITSNSVKLEPKHLIILTIPIVVLIYFSKILNNFSTKASGIQFLLLPSTSYEKFLAEVFFIILPIPIWYVTYHIGEGYWGNHNHPFKFNDTKSIIAFYALIFLISSINFKSKKNSIIWGIFSMFIFIMLFNNSLITNSLVAQAANVEIVNMAGFGNSEIMARKNSFGLKVDYPTWITELKRWINNVAYLALFIAGYFKIKEKEIK